MNAIERDVIVVGAGPAGSICASYLAKAGTDVLLIDKDIFPRDKACGDMITERFMRHITQLEAAEKLDRMSVFVNQMLMVSDGGREALVPFECYGTKRRELDQLLLDTAASWGAEVRQGVRVTGLVYELGRVCGVRVFSGGMESEIRAKIVIGADGALSGIARQAGLMREMPGAMGIGMSTYFQGVRLDRNIAIGQYSAYATVFFDRLFTPGYLWILPSGDGGVLRGHCNVGFVVDYADGSRRDFRDLEKRFREWLERSTRGSAMLSGARQVAPWRRGKQTYITQNMKKTAGGLILIGDAAAVMMPLRGDGLSAAADSARVAADTAWEAIRENDFSDAFLSRKLRTHESRPAAADVEDALKDIYLIRESMFDHAGMDAAIERIHNHKELAADLLGDPLP